MKPLFPIFNYSVSTMLLTVLHHYYGAVIYDSPFRLHVVLIAVPVILVLAASFLLFYTTRIKWNRLNKIALGTFLVTTAIFSVTAIGLYEGGYNHVLKNILYFTGVPVSFIDRLYPSVYELPNNWVFEVTGILQFVTGLCCLVYLRKFPFKVYFNLNRGVE